MAARIFLGLSALIWLPYGVLCRFGPAGLAESAELGLELGVVALTTWQLRRSPARAV